MSKEIYLWSSLTQTFRYGQKKCYDDFILLYSHIRQSVLDEVAVDLLHNRTIQLLNKFLMLFFILRQLYFVLLRVRQNVLANQVFKLVAVFQVWELADHAVDSVKVQEFQKLFQKGSNFWIHCLNFLLFLLVSSRLSYFFQKFLVFLFDNDSRIVLIDDIFIGPDNQTLDDVLFHLRESQ